MFLRSCTHAVRAAPLALGGLVQLRLQADEVVSSRTSVAQDDLSALLTHLAIVLMIRLVTVPLLVAWDWRQDSKHRRKEDKIVMSQTCLEIFSV